jgi:hypothetical protein
LHFLRSAPAMLDTLYGKTFLILTIQLALT